MSKPEREHGTIQSYVIGFVLSLIFTFIPYYLVVNQSVTGSALSATIIGFAVMQMIIQVTFFLHLGRGPKPKWNLFFFVATIGIIMVVVGGSLWIMGHLQYNILPSDETQKLVDDEGIYQISGSKTGACQGQHVNHKVTIIDSKVSPEHISASMCDTLTILNVDDVNRVIDFGPHEQHQTYAGESDLAIQKGQGKTITLSVAGTYQFHDHLQNETAGDFTVTQ